MTRAEANEAFDKHILDTANPEKRVNKKLSNGEFKEDYVYDCIAASVEGPVYFHFTLDEDPQDPLITIESAHKPL